MKPTQKEMKAGIDLYYGDPMHAVAIVQAAVKAERERVINAIEASIDDTAGNHPWLHVGELLAMLETFK